MPPQAQRENYTPYPNTKSLKRLCIHEQFFQFVCRRPTQLLSILEVQLIVWQHDQNQHYQ